MAKKFKNTKPSKSRNPDGRAPQVDFLDPKVLERVRQLAHQQLYEKEIAYVLGYNPTYFSELKLKYPELADALKKGYASGVAEVTEALMNNVRKGNIVAQIFFLKSKGGWHEDGRRGDTQDDQTAIAERISSAIEKLGSGESESGNSGDGGKVQA